MIIIPHKHLNYVNRNDIEVLFLGTFNPDTICNRSTFFYGRPRNFFWQLLPIAFGKPTLKDKHDNEKQDFLHENKIGIIDIIASVTGAKEEDLWDYDDAVLDATSPEWNDEIFNLIDSSRNLKTIFLTRKTFQGIPNIKKRFSDIEKYACNKGIHVEVLETPSRFTNDAKQAKWTKAIDGHLARVNTL
jgi:G:T/U-mismatch repair DNA glycosylase